MVHNIYDYETLTVTADERKRLEALWGYRRMLKRYAGWIE